MSSSSFFPQTAVISGYQQARRRTDTRIHDVFLSFRGKDTRASFTSHLYASLQNAGINVFRDDDSLKRGHCISKSIKRAIEESEISIIIFSKNYAKSRWCLNELLTIMECRRSIGQVVLPVFYDVDPSEVRHQTGEFGNSFEYRWNNPNINLSKTVREKKLLVKWRKALLKAASLAGFVVLNFRDDKKCLYPHISADKIYYKHRTIP